MLDVSSVGGHLNQVLPCVNKLVEADCEVFLVTNDVFYQTVPDGVKFFRISHGRSFFGYLKNFGELLMIYIKIRPDGCLSAGAAPGFLGIFIHKMALRGNAVWIESKSRVNTLSKAGLGAFFFVDTFVYQWRSLKLPTVKFFAPKSVQCVAWLND